MMQAGKLRTRLALQQPGTTQDGIGQPVVNWTEVGKVWADVRHVSGLQAIKADADSSTVKASIRIRHRTGVTAALRLVEEGAGTVYNITAVLPDARKEYLDLVCEVIT